MATHSFYIPNEIDPQVTRKLKMMASKQDTSISDLVTEIIINYVNQKEAHQGTKKGWAAKYSGTWKGSSDPQRLIHLIEKSRTRYKKNQL